MTCPDLLCCHTSPTLWVGSRDLLCCLSSHPSLLWLLVGCQDLLRRLSSHTSLLCLLVGCQDLLRRLSSHTSLLWLLVGCRDLLCRLSSHTYPPGTEALAPPPSPCPASLTPRPPSQPLGGWAQPFPTKP